MHSLYRVHAADLHRYLSRRVGRDLGDDLLADTFRIALEDWDGYDPEMGAARNWLYGIATNLVRRHWRTERRRRTAFERLAAESAELIDSTGAVADRLDAVDEAEHLLAAIAELDADDYDLLVLSAWESMSSADVAEVLGLARGTVRSRLHRIRRQLDAACTATPSTSTSSATTTTTTSANTTSANTKGDRS